MNRSNKRVVVVPIAAVLLAAVIAGGIYLRQLGLRETRPGAAASRARVAAVTVRHDGAVPAPQGPNQVSPETDQTSSDYYILYGFVPYQDDQRLAEMGATSKEARERANRLFAATFFALVDAMAKRAEIQLNEPEHVILVSSLDQATRDQLRAQFYGELKEIVGQAKFDELVSKGPIASVEYGMLGFGEFPVVIDLQPPSAGEQRQNAVRLTLTTRSGGPSSGMDLYSVSQSIPARVFDRYFGTLREVANKSAFQWSGPGS
jgi:hypothetical protein